MSVCEEDSLNEDSDWYPLSNKRRKFISNSSSDSGLDLSFNNENNRTQPVYQVLQTVNFDSLQKSASNLDSEINLAPTQQVVNLAQNVQNLPNGLSYSGACQNF